MSAEAHDGHPPSPGRLYPLVGLILRIPSTVYRRYRLLPLIPFCALMAFMVWQLPQLRVTSTSAADLPAHDPVRLQQEQASRSFPPYTFVVMSIEPLGGGSPSSGGAYDPAVIEAVQRLSTLAANVPGVQTALSMSTLHDVMVDANAISFVPLLVGPVDGLAIQSLRSRIADTPLFRDFLVSRDGKAASIYLFLDPGANMRQIVSDIEGTCARERTVNATVFGEPVLTQYVQRNVVPDLILLGSLALLIVFLFELAATRSFSAAFVLWVMNLLPALWVLSFFPLAGLTLKMETIYAPIVIVALSTSYGLQLYRNLSLRQGRTMGETLDEVTPAIFSAGFTTILGFTSLFATTVVLLRLMGALLVAGIALALLSSLFILPLFLVKIPVRRHLDFSQAPQMIRVSQKKWVPIVFGCLGVFLAAGMARIGVDFRVESMLKGRSGVARTAVAYSARYGGLDTLELVIDTGAEYGWISPKAFANLRALRATLASAPHVSQVICVSDFVDWVHGRLAGAATSVAAEDETSIGESLELLSSQGDALNVSGLIDPSDAVTRIIIRFDTHGFTPRDASAALRGLVAETRSAAGAAFPDAGITVTGGTITMDRFLTLLVRSQVSGIFLYMILAFLFVAVFLRSLRWAVLSLLLPCSGVIIYLGMIGWLGVPLTGLTVLTIASIMGVGIDGLLCLVTFYRSRRATLSPTAALQSAMEDAGMAIIQSSLIIVLSLLCLLASRYSSFVWTGILTGITFLGCTAVTLLVIPHIILKRPGSLQ